MIENSRIYDGSYENKGSSPVEGSGTKVGFAQNEYFEYQIPKERMQIESLSDIHKLRIEYLDKNWDKKLSFDITTFKPSYAIVVDGMNTNSEWKKEDLVFEDATSKIYARQEVGYIFIYVDTSLVNNMNNYYAYLYLAGASAKDSKDYTRTLTRNKIYEGNRKNMGDYPIKGVYDYMIDEGIEYKIHVKDVDANSISDIFGVSFILRNKKTDNETVKIETEFDRSSFTNIKIDGLNDDWSDDYIFAKTENYQTYLGSDRNYLYFYGDITNEMAINYDTVQISFAIKNKSESFNDYIYEMNNNELKINSRSGTIITDYERNKGAEFKFALSNLDIKSYEEIIGIRFAYLRLTDAGVKEEVFVYAIHPNEDSNIVIDGENTNGEYNNYLLINGPKYKIYGLTSENMLYLYGEYNEITFDTTYLYIATKATSIGDYNFRISSSSSSIYTYVNGSTGEKVSGNLTRKVTENSFEFSLPLQDVGISSIEDIVGFKIRPQYSDSAGIEQDHFQEDIILKDKVIIDGIKNEQDYVLLGSNSSFDVYGFSGNDFMYIYTSFKDTTFDDFHIYFATQSKLDYNYRVENSSLRDEKTKDSINSSLLNLRTSSITEYAIPLTNLSISSIDDIKSLRINPLIDWNNVYIQDIFDIKNNIIIDGEISENEYPPNTLAGEADGVQLYMHKIDDYVLYSIKFGTFETPREEYTIFMCTESDCSSSSRLARIDNGKLRLLSSGESITKSTFEYSISPYMESVFIFSELDFNISDVKYFEVRLEDNNGDVYTVRMPINPAFSGME